MEEILTGVLIVISAIITLTGLRIVLRHLYRDIRRARVGDMVWFRIVPESRRSASSASSAQAQVGAMASFVNALSCTFPYFNRSTVSFVWHSSREDGMVSLYVGMSTKNPDVAFNKIAGVASGLNCRAEAVTELPDIPHKGLSVAFRSSNNPNMASQYPEDLGKVANALSNSMDSDGTFIITIEHMRSSERNKMAANLSEEVVMNVGQAALLGGGTAANAQVISSTAVRTSIAAAANDGSPDKSKALLELALGSINALAFGYSAKTPRWAHSRMIMLTTVPFIGALVALGIFGIVAAPTLFLVGLAPAILLIMSIAVPGPLIDSWHERAFGRGEVVVPPFFYFSPRRLIHGWIRANYRHDAAGDVKVGNRVSPPSCRQMIPMYAGSLTQMASIPHGVMANNVQTESVPMEGFPPMFESMNDDDIYLGQTGKNQVASIDLMDLTYGIYSAGAPGSGKTNMMQVIFAGVCRASRGNSRGLRITPFWAETKGEGALQAWNIVKHNPNALLVEAHNPNSEFRPALEGKRLTEGATPKQVATNCEALVAALQYAFGDAIRGESRQVLDFGLRIALFLMPDEIRSLDLGDRVNADKPNVIELVYLILGGDFARNPSTQLLELKDNLDQLDPREGYLYQAIATMQPYFDKNHPGFRMSQEKKAPAMNKLTELRNAKELWTPSDKRQDVYIPQLVRNFAPVVLNMGPYWDPSIHDEYSGEYGAYDQSISLNLARRCLLAYGFLMWNYINSKCTGWEKEGKRIILHYDELADIAMDTVSEDVPNLVAQITKQGRSKGCALYGASQSPLQLPLQARNEVLGFRTKIWYQLPNADDAKVAMNDLGMNTVYTADNIKRLPPQTGIGIAEIKQGSQITPAFTIKVPEVNAWAEMLNKAPDVSTAIRWYESEHS